jgi:hypothetical protein
MNYYKLLLQNFPQTQEKSKQERQKNSRYMVSNMKMDDNICYLLHDGFLLGSLFYSEDGGDMFLQNVSWLSMDYTALYPRI